MIDLLQKEQGTSSKLTDIEQEELKTLKIKIKDHERIQSMMGIKEEVVLSSDSEDDEMDDDE